MSQQNPIQEQIIAKAVKEETFRQEVLSNPKAAIERELGINVPQGVTIAMHQDTPTALHLHPTCLSVANARPDETAGQSPAGRTATLVLL